MGHSSLDWFQLLYGSTLSHVSKNYENFFKRIIGHYFSLMNDVVIKKRGFHLVHLINYMFYILFQNIDVYYSYFSLVTY